jgi:hypothetical protein
MDNQFTILAEIEEILSTISSLKDKTLDHYQENTCLAQQLLIDLSCLEEDANSLINEFAITK